MVHNCNVCHLQDAHEFLIFLLNELVDILERESKAAEGSLDPPTPSEMLNNGQVWPQANGVHKEALVTWVHKSFQVNQVDTSGLPSFPI